jgi:hypothetical protein
MHLRISNINSNNIATGNAITHDQALALLSGPVSNPSDARFMADGVPRILEPLGAPEGYVAIAPVSYVVEGYCVRKTYALESVEDHETRGAAERAAAEAEAVAQFQRDAYALSDELAEAYAAFMAAFEQAVGAAMMAGAQLDPTAVTYQSLVSALSQLEGDQWLKVANQLTGLWNIVVVHTRKTPGEAYDMLPMLEWRRQNPKQEGQE